MINGKDDKGGITDGMLVQATQQYEEMAEKPKIKMRVKKSQLML